LALVIGIGLYLAPTSRVDARQSAEVDRPEPGAKPKLDLETVAEKLIEGHNRLRKEEKLPSLSPSKKLQAAAEVQARDMAERSKMSHEGADGSTLADRIKTQRYDYRRIGENVAYGQYTIDQVMKGWMDSDVHRKNILGSFSQIGAAVVLDEEGVPYWCVTFGLPRRK
jgi:uncharacterized protein YkwD